MLADRGWSALSSLTFYAFLLSRGAGATVAAGSGETHESLIHSLPHQNSKYAADTAVAHLLYAEEAGEQAEGVAWRSRGLFSMNHQDEANKEK